ncbi:MAG: hypothetical protein IK152_03885 [Lachnospiraceae bacterium]|nr:hypothetical protein [Lachnospiraceae bacterium]
MSGGKKALIAFLALSVCIFLGLTIYSLIARKSASTGKTGSAGKASSAASAKNTTASKKNPSSAAKSSSSAAEKKSTADRTKEYVYRNNPELTPVNYESPALLGLTEDAGTAYRDKLYFICDSPTYWMWPYGLLGGGKDTKQIWTGPEGTQTLAYQSTYKILDPFDGQEKLIIEVVKAHQPEYIVIAMGINGIAIMSEESFIEEYTDLVTKIRLISPKTKILLSSIYPITKAYKHWGSITNASITKANSNILKIAEDTHTHYIDTFAAIVGDDGNAKNEYMRDDGLHPNEAGLTEILKFIRTHAYI